MVQLVYVSSTYRELPNSDLDSILEFSIRHNTPDKITGLLLCLDTSFLQIIEGNVMVLMETYNRISKDTRHHNVFLLPERQISLDAIENRALAPLFVFGSSYITLHNLGRVTTD